ncbi:C45 family peptidase [uncultured Parasutterella sp.]|uniref:C45 family autoproteolytic acyltransferase/hydolase n=3 Tax=uncultured Parasutterella sp. TaxID=1263098 RepID=UPI002597A189|nr:C45 family peptidase [uncultured Parasutterella sp.]
MIIRRKFIAALVSSAFCCFAAQAKVASELSVPNIHSPEIEKQPFYPFIELKGSALQRGVTYGQSAAEQIDRNIKFYASVFQSSAGIDWEKAKSLAAKFLPVIQKYSPESIEEMKGIAQGSGKSFEDILTLNCRSEVLFANSDACTCIMVPAELGEGGNVFMGQTWDWLAKARSNSVILKVEQEGRPEILMVCEAGLVGGKGLNSEGLGVCLNAASVGKGKIGMPLHLMMRNILNSSLPTEALKAVSAVPRAGSGVFNIASRSNYEMQVEFSPDAFDVIMSKGEALVHTNHYLSALIAPKDVAKSFISSTYTRLNGVQRQLSKMKGPIGMKGLFRLLSDHELYPESVCYHEDPRQSGERYCTVYAMVMDVTSGILWISAGYPCEGKISEYRL